MHRRRTLSTLGIGWLLLIGLIAVCTAGASSQVMHPRVSIRDAIGVAENHVKLKQIHVAGMHIASAVYHSEPEHPHWAITWKSNEMVKGGWFVVLVQTDVSCKVEYGE